MLKNKVCPYCRVILSDKSNTPNKSSVEHLIPNKLLTQKRTRNDGDFFACRKCNCRKSNIDYVLSVVAQIQSSNTDLAVSALVDALEKNDGRVNAFIQMLRSAEQHDGGLKMSIPINGPDLLEYIHFLGKGQFFRLHRIPFDPKQYVLDFQFINKPVMASVENSYCRNNESNPFVDVAMNPRSEVIGNGECIIWRKNDRYLFFFHNYIAIVIEVLKRNKKNIARVAKRERQLLDDFK